MVDVVRDMHARSGLTEEVRRSTVSVREAEERVDSLVSSELKAPPIKSRT